MGEILRLVGMSFFMSDHFTMVAKPPSILSFVSFSKQVAACLGLADGWQPLFNAAMMCSSDQGSPQSTGQPCSLYVCSRGAAG